MRARIPLSVAIATVAAVLAVSVNWPDPTAAATVAAKWSTQVKVGVRSQGSATINAYTTGTGALSLRLSGLRPYATYSVGLYAGTCSAHGSRISLLPAVTSTASGTVTRGLTLGRILATRLRTLLRSGHVSVAIGGIRRCGTLVRASLTPSPTPTPSPSPLPGATPSPTPTPMATPIPMPSPTPTPYNY